MRSYVVADGGAPGNRMSSMPWTGHTNAARYVTVANEITTAPLCAAG